jgi:hypothetical protein
LMPSQPKTRPLAQRLLWPRRRRGRHRVVRAATVDRTEMKFLRQLYTIRALAKLQIFQRDIWATCQRAIRGI